MAPIRYWKLAQPPNYDQNIDRKYPYSEVPYIGEYNLVKLPTDDKLIDHVDYWGEGRIETKQGNSGFKDCYNVNHQTQVVSNGADRDRKIPNRIPVENYENCDTSSYIKDNSVKYVTIMGAPIIKNCAKDIARIVNNIEGKVVIYGFDDNSNYVKHLDEELKQKGLIFCYGYELSEHLKSATLFDSQKTYLTLPKVSDKLYTNVTNGKINDAIRITEDCIKTENKNIIRSIVDKLLNDGVSSVMLFAYKVWINNKDIIGDCFPFPFKEILNEDHIKIIGKQNNLPLKLSPEQMNEADGNIIAWGDGEKSQKEKHFWKFIPILEEDKIYFEIQNIEFGLKLTLDTTTNEYGDRTGIGTNGDGFDFRFRLEPKKLNDDIVFLIFNEKTGQCLKLDMTSDNFGNRKLWGNDYFVVGDYDRFGWSVEPTE